jgi:site-specific DNA-methyltransferase (adenine-specific)
MTMINLLLGDCLEEMKKIPDGSVDLIVTDPPYGMNFQSNYRKEKHRKIDNDDRFPVEVFDEFFRIASKGVYVFCRWDNLHSFPKPKSFLVWVKNNWSMGDLKHEHGRQWEGIAFYNMAGHEFVKRIPDVIHANRTGNKLHPTEKPVDLMETIIRSNVGETVLDPFMGSGTTGVACKNLNRKFIGIELDPTYFEIAKKRIYDQD